VPAAGYHSIRPNQTAKPVAEADKRCYIQETVTGACAAGSCPVSSLITVGESEEAVPAVDVRSLTFVRRFECTGSASTTSAYTKEPSRGLMNAFACDCEFDKH